MTGTPLWACWLAAGLSAGALIGVVWLSARRTARSVDALADWARQVGAGGLELEVPIDRSHQLGKLSLALTEMVGCLRGSAEAQHQLEGEHMTELEQRERLVETMTRVGRVSAGATEQQALLEGVAKELAALWPRYSLGLYLLSDDGASATLRVEAGSQDGVLSPCRQRVAVGDGTTVGQCLATGKMRAWPETHDRADRLERVFQAGARSEMAVPVRVRGRLLGVISIHSDRLERFPSAFTGALETTGDQLACALESLRLARSTREAEAGGGGSGTSTEQAWSELLRTRGSWGYRYAAGQVEATDEEWPPEMSEALRTGQVVRANLIQEGQLQTTRDGVLAMPVKVHDQVVGALGFRREGPPVWTEREIEVLQLIALELGNTLVAAQLYEAAQRNAVQQQIVAELSSRMRQTLDVETVLRTAAAEVRQALGLSEVVVRLDSPVVAEGEGSGATADKARA